MNESFIVLFLFGDEARIFLQKSVIGWFICKKKYLQFELCTFWLLWFIFLHGQAFSPPQITMDNAVIYLISICFANFERQSNQSMIVLIVLVYVLFGLYKWMM